MNFNPQIINKDNIPEFVVLPCEEYDELIRLLEDKEDLKAIDEFHANNEETFPAELVEKLAQGESPIKVFREWRNFSQATLAKEVNVSRQYLNQIERKVRVGNVKTLKKIAEKLKVTIDLLIQDNVDDDTSQS